MDIDDIYGHKTNKEMFDWIKENLDFDQLIYRIRKRRESRLGTCFICGS